MCNADIDLSIKSKNKQLNTTFFERKWTETDESLYAVTNS